ncbi:MAG: tripartite tricarboxylate transporter substrate binding protein [Betaproteobacteria bacterium]|nr:tripartite tricarboxylate transporter substrate binding protein [Betaproteobacteria bacterium]
MKPRQIIVLLIAASAWLMSGVALAQTYPTKPVRMIVPFPPGGATDLLARVVAQKLSESLGHQVVVDNRPGAGGTIGSRLMLDAPPDGYTILTSSVSTHAIGPHLYAKPPYDPMKDFAAITELSSTPTVLMVSGTLPVATLKEFIALAKARSGQFNYGSSGVGTQFHLSGELLKLQTGINMTHIPFKGTALVYPDLFSGQVSMLFDTLSVAIPFIKAGRVKALGVTGTQRTPTLPDVPTIAEAGVPGFSAGLWLGIWGPAKLPRDIAERLSSDVAKLLKLPDVKERLASQGMEPIGNTPAQFAEFVRKENETWSKVVKAAGVKAE